MQSKFDKDTFIHQPMCILIRGIDNAWFIGDLGQGQKEKESKQNVAC